MLEEHGEIKIFMKIWLKVLISLIYTYFIVSKLPSGKFRILALLPIVTLFALLPLSLSNLTMVSLTGIFISTLANTKLILFAFNIGPLSENLPRKSVLTFMSIAAFPIKIKPNETAQTTNNNVDKKISLGLWSKLLISSLIVVVGVYSNNIKNVHPNVFLFIHSLTFYLCLEIIFGVVKIFVGFILGTELVPPFNEPYLSTSLHEFWGKRWNVVASDVLRQSVYVPVKAFLEVHIGKRWSNYLATMATFLVSGLMHELLTCYTTRAGPTWEYTCFFLLHGVCMVAETVIYKDLGCRELHWVFSGPLTLGFVLTTRIWLLFPILLKYYVFLSW